MMCESMKVADDYCKPCATPMSIKEGLQLVWWILSVQIIDISSRVMSEWWQICSERNALCGKEGLSAIV